MSHFAVLHYCPPRAGKRLAQSIAMAFYLMRYWTRFASTSCSAGQGNEGSTG